MKIKLKFDIILSMAPLCNNRGPYFWIMYYSISSSYLQPLSFNWRIVQFVNINIISVVEFQRWWALKSKIFGQKSTYSKEFFFLILSMNVSLSKIGHGFSNKGVQKLTLEMVFCYQNCSDLLWEKIVLVILQILGLQPRISKVFLDH